MGLSYWAWSAIGGALLLLLLLLLLVCACVRLRKLRAEKRSPGKVERISDEDQRQLLDGGAKPDVSLLVPPLKEQLRLASYHHLEAVSSAGGSPRASGAADGSGAAGSGAAGGGQGGGGARPAVANLTGKAADANPEQPWTMEDRAAFYHLAKQVRPAEGTMMVLMTMPMILMDVVVP